MIQFLNRLFPYLRPYAGRYAVGLVLVLIGVVTAVASPWIARAAIDGLSRGELARPLGHFAAVLILLGLARAALSFQGRFTIIAASRDIELDLRNALYSKLLRLPSSFFDRSATGDLESRVINDVEGVRMVCGVAVMMIVSSGLLALLSAASMFLVNTKLAAISAAPLVLISVITALLTPRIYEESEKVQDKLSGLSTVAQENFSGVRVVRAFSLESAESLKFRRASSEYVAANLSLSRTRGFAWGLMELLLQATAGITLLAGGLGIIDGSLSAGDFVAFTAYQFMLSWPVIAMGWIVTVFQRGSACMERIAKILDEPDEEANDPAVFFDPPRGAISIRNLTFRYAADRPPALAGVSLEIAVGERLALVGRTGSGKSTLLQILSGLYRPPRGTVFLDGKDINDYDRSALREEISTASQEAFLFSDSLFANVAFGAHGKPPAEKVSAACESSQLSADLDQFPNGIEQVVGERGITLSGGQKQRTALARALIREPRILLLDDALASVDVETEKKILSRLDEHLQGKTCLIATHRFSILSKAQRIAVFDDGRLTGCAPHESLLAENALYAELVRRQSLEDSLKST